MASSPPTIDMGSRFPLRSVVRPELHNLPYALLLAVLFLVLPLAYYADPQSKAPTRLVEAWPHLVVSLAGLLALPWIAICLRSRVVWTIDGTAVEVSLRGLFTTQTSREPLSAYTSLATPLESQPGFVRPRRRFTIILVHATAPVRRVVLYAGPDEERFQERLEAHRRLFALPIEPPGQSLSAPLRSPQ